MTKYRWLSASLVALLISGTAVWSQGTPLSLQGLFLLPGPQAAQSASSSLDLPPPPQSLPQLDPVSDEGRDVRAVNQARATSDDLSEEQAEQNEVISDLVSDYLRSWAQAFKIGDYKTAQTMAEKAAKLDPSNLAAQHACVVTRLVSRMNGCCSEEKCQAACESACKSGPTPACCTDGVKAVCMPPACNRILSIWNPILGCAGAVCSSDDEGACPCTAKACGESCASKCGANACGASKCCAKGEPCPSQATGYRTVAAGKADGCCKGSCNCCGNCVCKATPKSKQRSTKVIMPMWLRNGVEIDMQMMQHPPIVISGFCPFGSVPGMNTTGPWVMPMPASVPCPVAAGSENQYRLMSRASDEAPKQSAYQIKASDNVVNIRTPNLEAVCDRMTCLGTRDRVLLEGNVRLTCKKDGQTTRIEAPCVLVDLLHGTFTVESSKGPAIAPPATVGCESCPAEREMISPAGYAPAAR